MICWYCYWGWAKPVAEIYLRALDDLSGYDAPLLHGPAHVVWADENFGHAQSCLDDFGGYEDRYTAAELAIVRRSLEELAVLPEEVWDIEPEDYDDENPQDYPPSVEVIKVK